MNLDPQALLASPEYHCLGMTRDRGVFCRMDREHYRQSIFLDRRVRPLDPQTHDVPLVPLFAAAVQLPTPEVRWIYHIAHCGSTLLSRLLDQPGASLGLREPPALRQLGIERAEGAAGDALQPRLALARVLSARRFDPSEPTVIKANVPVNFLIDLLNEQVPNEASIALYLGWEDYLLAILRTDKHRVWVERITGIFRAEIEQRVPVPTGSSIAVRAAALWLAQMDRFAALIDRNPRAVGLDAERFFADPMAVAKATATHLDLPGVDATSNAALIGSYSKDPSRQFDSRARRERAMADRNRLANDLRSAGEWLDLVSRQRPVFTRLHRLLKVA